MMMNRYLNEDEDQGMPLFIEPRKLVFIETKSSFQAEFISSFRFHQKRKSAWFCQLLNHRNE